MEVFVFTRAMVEAGLRIKPSYVVISIRNTGEPKAKVKKQAGLRGVLYLAFSGVEPVAGWVMPPRIKLITPAQADKICTFVRRHKANIGAIAVHCEKGTSRSPAVAAAICDALHLDGRRFWQLHRPSTYVYRMVSDAFNREARARNNNHLSQIKRPRKRPADQPAPAARLNAPRKSHGIAGATERKSSNRISPRLDL